MLTQKQFEKIKHCASNAQHGAIKIDGIYKKISLIYEEYETPHHWVYLTLTYNDEWSTLKIKTLTRDKGWIQTGYDENGDVCGLTLPESTYKQYRHQLIQIFEKRAAFRAEQQLDFVLLL